VDIFEFRDRLISDYSAYSQSFVQIKDARIREHIESKLSQGLLWPEALVQLNPSFQPGAWIDDLIKEGILNEGCGGIFRIKSNEDPIGKPLRIHRHQEDAIRIAKNRQNYVLTTGTGSGKSLSYIIPIVDSVLRIGTGKGIQAIIVYPMNALANSQLGELEKFIHLGFAPDQRPIRFRRYTGQEKDTEREEIVNDPPDILLTNYVMLEYILTRPRERETLVKAAQGLRFLVLDELHTYRGRQGSDVALLVRRVRDALDAKDMQCVGTSATLAGEGSFANQQREVAELASRLFGAPVEPQNVIGETLRRVTPEWREEELAEQLTACLGQASEIPGSFDAFVELPLASWIESTFGVRRDQAGRWVRNVPRTLSSAAAELARKTGFGLEACSEAARQVLMKGFAIKNPDTGFPVFAFRLHQFISRGDTAHASLEGEADRYITVQGQQFVPGRPGDLLFPLAFCRQCGQEYYSVRRNPLSNGEGFDYTGRNLSDRLAEDGGEPGFIYVSGENPWPEDPASAATRVPADWLEEHRGQARVRPNRRDCLPLATCVDARGKQSDGGIPCAYVPAPFRFCLACGVSYGFRQSSDFAKLARLGSEGRSTATTILSLAAVLGLNEVESLSAKAKKLLSFTDNRQDASLQAGHFNDFIEVGLLRAALYSAVKAAGADGLAHDALGEKVVGALDLPKALFAADPEVRFAAEAETRRAFRDVVCYRLYRDLKRGWRIIAPNLEQCGLLEIRYQSLDEACAAEDLWERAHPALAQATADTRRTIAKVLLDYLRRELAIRVDYLDAGYQDRMRQRSGQHLREPWAIDENERLEHAAVVYPRAGQRDDYQGHVYLSARGGFGQYLGRPSTFPGWRERLALDGRQQIIIDLLEGLRQAGIVAPAGEQEGARGYQLSAAALRWVAGDGSNPFHDPISVPNAPDGGGRANPYFIAFYRGAALRGKGISAREHTAQVPYEERVSREEAFRQAKLPVLYCSPTMELGIDIAELNVVNLRNIPPTPANYAQRSGRAGRNGQPALVFTYCATGNSHDQYFFKRPERMVAGAVTPPRLDLANEDLVRAHVHALWLAESGLDLGTSLRNILDLEGSNPSLALIPQVRDSIEAQGPQRRAWQRARAMLATLETDLANADWYGPSWLEEVLKKIPLSFEQACERWRGLYRAALEQSIRQDAVIRDASRPAGEKNKAKRLRGEAESQLQLLTETANIAQSDFYSYRYFAGEGFLPGYNFPRLPISAYIAGRRNKDEFISRPRFLAISEFGPRAIIYHEGSRYLINRVIMPPRDESGAITHQAKRCRACGYLHPILEGDGPDVCEHCGTLLDRPLRSLFRMQSVATRRRARINSDEEERQRLGYELISGFRFAQYQDRPSRRVAEARLGADHLATLTYGQAATLWRVNLGWRKRQSPLPGFVLDTERGYWQSNDLLAEEDDLEDPLSQMRERVVPYVEDRRNCLLLEPVLASDDPALNLKTMASLQAALKNAIQVAYQLEDNELAVEPLPDSDQRRLLLFYEAAEGGAGVLRRLVDDPAALSRVATEALLLCHFDPESGEDLRRAEGIDEDCEAACYHCLMSYGNQRDHIFLDRHLIRDFLLGLRQAKLNLSPTTKPRDEHLARLIALCDSELEKEWLRFLEDRGLSMPTAAQRRIEACSTRPDFVYGEAHAVIYVDGPPHDYPQRQQRDQAQTACLEDRGYEVIRFHHRDDWAAIVAAHPHIFGGRS